MWQEESMNLYWIITLGLLAHFVLALFACLTVKDSFSLTVQRKKSYYFLALLLPLLGSILAFRKVSKSKSSSNAYSSGVYIGGESSDCSGSDGGGGE